ncbi:MAG: hypothetical protein OXF88_21195 [Rhodobacteraceae bacterium]|nr:hypothetical protein [Paracoccaceae bacterium]
MKPESHYRPPPKGWIRAIRDALSMSGAHLGRRVGVEAQCVADFEKSEALDCAVVYALIPRSSLKDMIQRRARKLACRELIGIAHTIDLEAQGLSREEREGLLQTWITYRRDLNAAEQTNIAAGTVWAWRVRRRNLLEETFLRQLHKRLFGDVWVWAGEFHRTERNIGIETVRIPSNSERHLTTLDTGLNTRHFLRTRLPSLCITGWLRSTRFPTAMVKRRA